MSEDTAEFQEWINFYRVWKFHGFNHDMNDAHGFVPNALLIALSQMKGKIWEGGDAALEKNVILSPGMLHLGMLEQHIPSHMIIARVSTKFGEPLYVSVRGNKAKIRGVKSEKPYVAGGKETPGVEYNFKLTGPGLFGEEVELFGNGGANIVAFPDSVPSEEIFGYFRERFNEISAAKDNAVDMAGKKTDITEEHDSFYWNSVRPSQDWAREAIPIRRAGGISQLELIAKLPRVLSLYREKVENRKPDYLMTHEPSESHAAYAELEESMGIVVDAAARAHELANQLLYVYVNQDAVFNPIVRCHLGDMFVLSAHLTRAKRVKQSFVSQLDLPGGCAYVDASNLMVAPLVTGQVAGFLHERKIDIRTMAPFE